MAAGPSARANESPCSAVVTTMGVSPNSSRLSQNGTGLPMVAPRPTNGCSATPVTQNGNMAME